MRPSMKMRVVWGLVGAVLSLAACRASQSNKTAEPVAASPAEIADGGGAPLATSPVLYADEHPTGKLVAFKGDADFSAWADEWKESQDPNRPAFKMPGGDAGAPSQPTRTPARARPAPSPAPAASAAANAEARSAADSDSKKESITNNQHAAVDEGDIVKLHGDHLVVLRRGRLFTISLEGDKIKQSQKLDAFGPDIDPRGSWYDEMVIEGDHVVVVGFSYQRGGTEIGLFKIDDAGGLTYRATFHLKSNDYYSARNYASRIVDGRLVFYSPLYLYAQNDLTQSFPAFRRWQKGASGSQGFMRTLSVQNLYHLDGELPTSPNAALHTVTTCDLREPELTCESTAIVGPPGRVFYVSPSYVYVWMQDFARRGDGPPPLHNGLLAKMPIGRARNAPTAVRVSGMPTDQFSFDEDDSGQLNVLVRSQSNGDAMFASESTAGAAALLQVPATLFSDSVYSTSSRRYRVVPRPDGYSVQNRFVGKWLMYGSGQGYIANHQGRGQLFAVRYDEPSTPVSRIDLDQGVDRIEPMGDDAVVVGSRGADLVFTPVELDQTRGASPQPREAHARRDYVRTNAAQGELRSHGFFYKPSKTGPREGIIGLPIRTMPTRGAGYLLEGSASVLFLSHHALELNELGSLKASKIATNHDGCRASCVDWYGNARPIFAKGRIFALMGYDLVEGRVDGKAPSARIVERARLNFAPLGGPPASEWD